jgi:tetratricopeptide (TPR) repeat protein
MSLTVNRGRAIVAAAAIACTLLVLGAYSNSLDGAFHFDDSHVIENNLYIRSLKNIPRFFADASTFSSIPSHGSYRPLVSTTLAIDYAIGGGLAPRQFHRTQIALLGVLGALLAVFYERLLREAGAGPARMAALGAAALFAVHTANTETLNLISARSEELAVLGVVGAFLLYLALPRLRWTGLHLVPMAIGALAKVHAVMYGPLLFVYAWLWSPAASPREKTRDAVRQSWPALVAAAVVYAFVRRMDTPEWTGGGTERLAYAWTQPFVWLHYARLFFLPIGLTADTDWSVFPHWYDTRAIAGYLFVVVLVVIVSRTWREPATRPIAFGIAWFAIALAPTSSVVPFSEVMNEHRVFFPYVGLTLAVVWAAVLAVRRPAVRRAEGAGTLRTRVAVAAALVALVALGVSTWSRNRIWRTEESLWRDVTEKSPANGRGLMNYGLTRMRQGDYAGASASFARAGMLLPNYSTLEINRGIVEGALGQRFSADAHFRRALELAPDADGHFFYARWLAETGRGPEAITHLRSAIAISRGYVDARHLLMRLASAAGDEPTVAATAGETLALDPGDPEAAAYARGDTPMAARAPTSAAAMSAGLAALSAKRHDEAAELFRQVIRLDPRSADGWNNRGWAQLQLGFPAAAAASFERALAIDPASERVRNNLALTRAK